MDAEQKQYLEYQIIFLYLLLNLPVQIDFISEKLGKEGRDWKTKSVSSQNVGTRKCEIITVENIKEQSERSFYFDITEYSDSWE